MRRIIMGLVTVGALGVALSVARAAHKTPDAKLALHEGSVAAGVGISWGKGSLSYRGKQYRVSVNGLSVGDLGVSKIEAAGEVYNLGKLDDFDGNYTAVGAGLTIGGGGGVVAMRNQNGVQVELVATTQGIKLALGDAGVSMKIERD